MCANGFFSYFIQTKATTGLEPESAKSTTSPPSGWGFWLLKDQSGGNVNSTLSNNAISPVLETAQNQAGPFSAMARSRAPWNSPCSPGPRSPRQFSELLASAGQVSFLQQGADDVRLRLSRHRSGTPAEPMTWR